jgi:hypothetical protein
VRAEQRSFGARPQPGTDDAHDVVAGLGMGDHYESSDHRPDGEETILLIAVVFVVDHETVGVIVEQSPNLLERDPMLVPVRPAFSSIPLYSHQGYASD